MKNYFPPVKSENSIFFIGAAKGISVSSFVPRQRWIPTLWCWISPIVAVSFGF